MLIKLKEKELKDSIELKRTNLHLEKENYREKSRNSQSHSNDQSGTRKNIFSKTNSKFFRRKTEGSTPNSNSLSHNEDKCQLTREQKHDAFVSHKNVDEYRNEDFDSSSKCSKLSSSLKSIHNNQIIEVKQGRRSNINVYSNGVAIKYSKEFESPVTLKLGKIAVHQI